MLHFFEWFSHQVRPEEPWLILGKGPTFALRERYDLSGYHLFSLNHAVREQPVLVAHAIDLDAVQACSDVLEMQAQFVVMPWYPHVENRPGDRPLPELCREVPVLQRLSAADRLLWYDLSTSPVRHGSASVVQARYFSAEAGLSLLALAGARSVRTLGVDGGSDYSRDFEDLRGSTLLSNGRDSFDLQFEGFAKTILATGVDVAPLTAPAPARVVVAHGPQEVLPVAVLRHSIRRRASLSTELVALPTEGAPPDLPPSPAIVLTPRLQCVSDIRSLWIRSAPPGQIALPAMEPRHDDLPISLAVAGPGLGPELYDLARSLQAGASAAQLPIGIRSIARPRLGTEWIPDVRHQPRRSRFVRYTADGSEPWLSRAHPLGYLWVRDLLEAVESGAVASALIEEEIGRGHIRPSLGYQVAHRIDEPLLLPARARRLDRGFRPAESPPGSGGGAVARSLALLQALARKVERAAAEPQPTVGRLVKPQQ